MPPPSGRQRRHSVFNPEADDFHPTTTASQVAPPTSSALSVATVVAADPQQHHTQQAPVYSSPTYTAPPGDREQTLGSDINAFYGGSSRAESSRASWADQAALLYPVETRARELVGARELVDRGRDGNLFQSALNQALTSRDLARHIGPNLTPAQSLAQRLEGPTVSPVHSDSSGATITPLRFQATTVAARAAEEIARRAQETASQTQPADHSPEGAALEAPPDRPESVLPRRRVAVLRIVQPTSPTPAPCSLREPTEARVSPPNPSESVLPRRPSEVLGIVEPTSQSASAIPPPAVFGSPASAAPQPTASATSNIQPETSITPNRPMSLYNVAGFSLPPRPTMGPQPNTPSTPVRASRRRNSALNQVSTPRLKHLSNGPLPSSADVYPEDSPHRPSHASPLGIDMYNERRLAVRMGKQKAEVQDKSDTKTRRAVYGANESFASSAPDSGHANEETGVLSPEQRGAIEEQVYAYRQRLMQQVTPVRERSTRQQTSENAQRSLQLSPVAIRRSGQQLSPVVTRLSGQGQHPPQPVTPRRPNIDQQLTPVATTRRSVQQQQQQRHIQQAMPGPPTSEQIELFRANRQRTQARELLSRQKQAEQFRQSQLALANPSNSFRESLADLVAAQQRHGVQQQPIVTENLPSFSLEGLLTAQRRQQPRGQQPLVQQPLVQQPLFQHLPAHQLPARQLPAHQYALQQPPVVRHDSIQQSHFRQSPTQPPSTQQPTIHQPRPAYSNPAVTNQPLFPEHNAESEARSTSPTLSEIMREADTSDLEPDNRALSPGQEDGSRYGTGIGGIGLHRPWNAPPAQENQPFRVRPRDHEGWGGWEWAMQKGWGNSDSRK